MDDILFNDIKEIRFVKRPIAVPYNYRIMYKIAQIVLIMGTSCGNKGCSLEKLHMISMGLNSTNEMDNMVKFVEEKVKNYTLIRFDPSVNRTVLFAIAENIIYRQGNGLLRLSQKGKNFLAEIKMDKELLKLEKSDLKRISNKLTEEKIRGLMADWRINNV